MNSGNLLAAAIGMLCLGAAAPGPASALPDCDEDNAGLKLPDGFCALKIADRIGPTRHLAVADNGDVYVAIPDQDDDPGGVVAMRDTSGDGRMDEIIRFGERGGSGIAIRDGDLYFSEYRRILRIALHEKHLGPSGDVEVIASGFPEGSRHLARPFAFAPGGRLHVSAGAPADGCAQRSSPAPPGQAPCTQPDYGGGIWQFDMEVTGQQQSEALRYATGIGHVAAMAWHPVDKQLYALQHAREATEYWPGLHESGAVPGLPSTELLRVTEGVDFGWPYCHHDLYRNKRMLAPEFGGDGQSTGECNERYPAPELAFPNRYIPKDLLFYSGEQFPEDYRHGAFIAFHHPGDSSAGRRGRDAVVFVPFDEDGRVNANGDWRTFAEGFPSDGHTHSPDGTEYRSSGLAQGRDGSLYVSNSRRGTIWRIVHRRQAETRQDGGPSPLHRFTGVVDQR
jgi:glucose/arabinose dehydrogenase